MRGGEAWSGGRRALEEETLGLDAAREEARTRLALGMGVAYRTDKRKRREDGAPREPRKEHRGSPARSAFCLDGPSV